MHLIWNYCFQLLCGVNMVGRSVKSYGGILEIHFCAMVDLYLYFLWPFCASSPQNHLPCSVDHYVVHIPSITSNILDLG